MTLLETCQIHTDERRSCSWVGPPHRGLSGGRNPVHEQAGWQVEVKASLDAKSFCEPLQKVTWVNTAEELNKP